LIAHVSAIFLLPVFEKSVIFNDFRDIWHSISAEEGGNTVCCNAMARTRTVGDSVTCWFPWKHPMARRRGLEFCVFNQMPPKTGSPARPFGPRLWSNANAPGANFSPFDVRLAVSDMLRLTPTTPSVKEYRSRSVVVLTPFLWFYTKYIRAFG